MDMNPNTIQFVHSFIQFLLRNAIAHAERKTYHCRLSFSLYHPLRVSLFTSFRGNSFSDLSELLRFDLSLFGNSGGNKMHWQKGSNDRLFVQQNAQRDR